MSEGRTDYRAVWRGMPLVGRVAVALACVAVLASAWSLWGFARALLAPSAEVQGDAKGDEDLNKKYRDSFERRIAQIDGRSLFLLPGPPVDPEAERKKKAEAEAPVKPQENPKPTSYGGPAMIAMINGVAWFDDGKKLAEGGESQGDLRVVRLRPPWEAVVEWKGVEFTVGLFSRDSVVIDPRRDEDARKKLEERAKAPSKDVQVVKGNA